MRAISSSLLVVDVGAVGRRPVRPAGGPGFKVRPVGAGRTTDTADETPGQAWEERCEPSDRVRWSFGTRGTEPATGPDGIAIGQLHRVAIPAVGTVAPHLGRRVG